MESQLSMAGCENSFDTKLTMDPVLDQPPPPPYQGHNNPMHQSFPSSPSPPSLSSPPPTYSQIFPNDLHLPAAPPQLPSRHGGASPHLPSQLGHGGARPKRLQQANQQMTNRQINAALRQAGAGNNQRTVAVSLKEEGDEEMGTSTKRGVVICILVVMLLAPLAVLLWSLMVSPFPSSRPDPTRHPPTLNLGGFWGTKYICNCKEHENQYERTLCLKTLNLDFVSLGYMCNCKELENQHQRTSCLETLAEIRDETA